MATLRFALAQFDFPVGAVANNGERMRELMDEARDTHGAQLIAFPELTIAGYPPEDLLLRPSFLAACEREAAEVASAAKGIAAYYGHPHAMGEVYNAASLAIDGEVVFTTHKQALPNYTVFDEKRYFQSGSHSAVTDFGGVRVGWLICEDIWEEEPAAHAVAQGAELLMVINASPFDVGKSAQRAELLARRARENEVAIAYVNVVGGQDDLVFDGGSLLVEPDGRIAAQAPAMLDTLLIADYDTSTRRFVVNKWPQVDESLESRAYAALVRAVRDYVQKNHFPGVLLGLSGGIDSSLVLALAVDALGAECVTAVRLPSRYTSDLSNDLAAEQAKKLGVELLTIAIEEPFKSFLRELNPAFESVDHASGVDVTEENLQSRCRGILLMALSNKTGRMVLSTGNKSEYAVGYATIYGDMCGGYAPIKDCYKQLVYALAKWRNQQGDGDVIPVQVIDRPPSAELRENQTDQDSLPPYEELDAILERFIDDEQSQAEIVVAGFDEATVRRIARLVLTSEYKRRQSAPGPKISTRAFGRDRRYPITSGWR
jgi:NAD+ synthase (glutamine-hydrolysing)